MFMFILAAPELDDRELSGRAALFPPPTWIT